MPLMVLWLILMSVSNHLSFHYNSITAHLLARAAFTLVPGEVKRPQRRPACIIYIYLKVQCKKTIWRKVLMWNEVFVLLTAYGWVKGHPARSSYPVVKQWLNLSPDGRQDSRPCRDFSLLDLTCLLVPLLKRPVKFHSCSLLEFLH